jgi:hypothetical protein
VGVSVSVREAVKTLLTIEPELCERYVRSWRADIADWGERLDGIAEMQSIEAALRELGLTPVTSTRTDKRRTSRQEAPPSATAGPVAIPLSGTIREMSERARKAAVTATDASQHPAPPRRRWHWWR